MADYTNKTLYKRLTKLIFPAKKIFSPEKMHNSAIWALKKGLVPSKDTITDASITSNLWGIDFPNPVGLAAGMDKNAEAITGLAKQGFGFIECGTVTPQPQDGNPKPRMFRLLEDEGVINRLGFNNKGAYNFLQNLKKHKNADIIVGANIGKNKDAPNDASDYTTLMPMMYPHADYITANISSPNTPNLRDIQDHLEQFVTDLKECHNKLIDEHGFKPLFIKIAPDLDDAQIESIAKTLLEQKVDGVIISNTTIARENLKSEFADEIGGLSGKPLFEKSTDTLRKFYKASGGAIPIIGVGGIGSGQDAYLKIRAGASLIQLYSMLVYEGMGLVNRINKELIDILKAEGINNIKDIIGIDS